VPPSEKSVHGEIVLITGAGHGMGRIYAQRFAALGAKLVASKFYTKHIRITIN